MLHAAIQPRPVLVCLGLALFWGCSNPQPPAIVPLTQLEDRNLAASPTPQGGAQLTAVVRAGGVARGYQLAFVRVLDWETASATLSNADPTIPTQTLNANAAVAADLTRTASFYFSPVKPTSGYTLTVTLKRRDASGTYQTVASGTNNTLGLANGANTLVVSLSPTNQGELSISAPQPTVVFPTPVPLAGNVTTLAGSNTSGQADGSATTATFSNPQGLGFGPGGKLYVADTATDDIRMINTALAPTDPGYVTTVAGTNSGFQNGPLATAKLNAPSGVCALGDGRIVVADTNNHCLRLVDTRLLTTDANYITTLAGTNTTNYVDGNATTARFNTPVGVVADNNNHVFVGDFNNNVIREVDLNRASTDSNFVTTFAGSGAANSVDGTGTGASFNGPSGLAIDYSGNLYVTDKKSHKIRKVTAAGVVTTLAGTTSGFSDGPLASAQFNAPQGLVLYNNLLFVGDTNNHSIRAINLNLPTTDANYVTTFAGTNSPGFADGLGAAARFNKPNDLATNGNGKLYVADAANHRVRLVQ